jgi:hypothetical protein
MMGNSKKLAILLSNNWLFHDEQKYEKIRLNSIELFKNIKYSQKESKHISKKIKQLYVLADKDELISKKTFETMISICDGIDIFLNQPLKTKNSIYWWKAFRSKNYFLGFLYLIKDQLSKLGWKNFFLAFFAAKKLFSAGVVHKKRDWEKVRKLTEQYWEIILSTNHKKFVQF